jgi:predicted Holliday junction resolvase-like endonuclease
MDQRTIVLIGLIAVIFLYMGYRLGRVIANLALEARLPAIRREAAARSRAVLGGQFSEQLAPFLPDFPYSPTEARYLGRPLDFIVFKGLDEGEPTEIIFVEVKSGGSQLSTTEQKLRQVIEAGRVRWHEYRIPHPITGR